MPDTASKILRIAGLSEIHHTDPLTAQDTKSMFVVKQLFESPYGTVHGSTEIEPLLFDGPITETGPGIWCGKVRSGVKFSDGSAMTPADVLASLEASGIVNEMAEMELRGDEIHFRLERPNARFALTLAHGQCGVVKRQGDRILGTGPFVLHPDSRPQNVRLVRNPHHEPPAKVDEVHFVAYPLDGDGRPTALLEAIAQGTVDLTSSLGRDDLMSVSGMRKKILPGTSTCFLYLNSDSPRLADARVRRAIGHSIDRLELAKICYSNALAFAASSVLPRTLGAVDDRLSLDRQKARALIDEVGGAAPQKLRMLMIWGPRPYLPDPMGVAENLKEQISSLGIDIEILPTSSSKEHFEQLVDGDHDMVLSGWVADTMDPADYLESVLASYRVPNWENLAVSANSGRLRNSEMDRLIAQSRGDQSSGPIEKIVELMEQEAPLVPLIYGASATVCSYRVENFQPSPMAHYPLTELDVTDRA